MARRRCRPVDRAALEAYCDAWIAAWNGSDPTRLLAYYADACVYADPAKPDGLQGKDALARYFRRLMAAFPDMDWRRRDLWPLEGGFVVQYVASVTVNGQRVTFPGMDLVLLDEGKIVRNDVFFDRTAWSAAQAK